MGLVAHLEKVIEESKAEYQAIKTENFVPIEELNITHICGQSSDFLDGQNILALGDNAVLIRTLLEKNNLAGKIQTIYIDPPFFSKANYDAVIEISGDESDGNASCGGKRVKHPAYDDVWEQGMEAYLKMLCVRLMLMKDLLSDEGTIWVHLDWHSVHYVKILLDEIFGDKNFVNEIIWTYKSGGSSKRHFARKHDTILVYGKTKRYYLNLPKEKSYNRGLKPYRFKGVEEFCDNVGWYTLVKMKDVWSIDMVGRTSSERTGYATQKPEALLRRIIEASSREGDLVADFFCGSGTCGAAAAKLGRRWICCDNGRLAISDATGRLYKDGLPMKVIAQEKLIGTCKPGLNGGNADILAEIYGEHTLFPDKIIITLKLIKYNITENLQESKYTSNSAAIKAAGDNPLALIKSWSVDYNFDGKVFKPDDVLYREKGKLSYTLEKEISISDLYNMEILIKAVDVFGNITFKKIDTKELMEE